MNYILGANHMFLFPESITNEKEHTKTLAKLSESKEIAALDCWLWRGDTAKEEAKILRASGKIINYNIGDRFGEAPSNPASPDSRERDEAYSKVMREIEYALSLDAKKIVFGSGKDFPLERDAAKERFFEFVMKILGEIPRDVTLAFEPTDRDIDKFFLYGPLDETVELSKRVRGEGFLNFGILLDMCHVPLMHETLESAISKAKTELVHIHLGNCVIKNRASELYGDKHPSWSFPDGEYSDEDGARFVKMLKSAGYFERDGATVSFEMRPYPNMSAEESLSRFVKIFKTAISED